MTGVENLARKRRWLLLALAVSFAIWHVAELNMVRSASEDASMVAVPVAILVWGGSMLALLLWGRKARDKAALEDELTRHNRSQALVAGFWVMLIAAGAGMVLAARVTINASDLARIIMVLGVAAPSIWFAYLERPGASNE